MKRISLRAWCCLCVLLYAHFFVISVWPETPEHTPDVDCSDGMVPINTEGGWTCTCAEGYTEDGFGGCVLVDCDADPSGPTCGGGGSGGGSGGGGWMTCDEIRDLYCSSDWHIAGVLFADGVAIAGCVASLGWGCNIARGSSR